MDDDGITTLLGDHDRQDRRLTWVLVLSAVVAVLVGLGTPAIISTSNTTRRVVEGNDVAACRAIASGKVQEARAQLDLARTEVELATSRALEAVAVKDNAAFLTAVDLLPKARRHVEDRVAALLDETAAYQDVVEASRADPTSLAENCG